MDQDFKKMDLSILNEDTSDESEEWTLEEKNQKSEDTVVLLHRSVELQNVDSLEFYLRHYGSLINVPDDTGILFIV